MVTTSINDPGQGADAPQLYFSRPATILPEVAVDNEESLSRLRECFRGTADEWAMVEAGVRWVFDRCSTQVRYFEGDENSSPGGWASRAAAACLTENGVDASDIDLVVYGGSPATRSEPATAAEVIASRTGATRPSPST